VATTSSFELHYLSHLCIDNVILPCNLPDDIQLVSLGILQVSSLTIA